MDSLFRGNIACIVDFNDDERVWLNSAARGRLKKEHTKERFIGDIALTLVISEDAAIVSMAEGLKEKIKAMSSDEWDALVTKLPLPVSYEATLEGAGMSEAPAVDDAAIT